MQRNNSFRSGGIFYDTNGDLANVVKAAIDAPVTEETPLQRPRPPEAESQDCRRQYHEENVPHPWTHRLSQRASTLWQASSFSPHPPLSHFKSNLSSEPKRKYSCKEMLCLCLLPCLIMALFLIALATLSTYFEVKKEWQTKYDLIKKELEDQRNHDGGIFITQEKQEEIENQVIELVRIRREFRDLSALLYLRSKENEKLKETLKSLGEKDKDLHFIPQIKERNTDNGQQTPFMIEDEEYKDLRANNDDVIGRRMKSLKDQNVKVSGNFQVGSSQRYDKLYRNQEEQLSISSKRCQVSGEKRDKLVQVLESATQIIVENIGAMDSKVKEKVTGVDSLAATRMHSEQKFLSKTLKIARANKDDQTTKHQTFLTSTLNQAQEREGRFRRRQKRQEGFISQIEDHNEMFQSGDISFAKKQEELNLATNAQQTQHFAVIEATIEDTRNEIKTLLKEKSLIDEFVGSEQELIKSHQKNLKRIRKISESLETRSKSLTLKLNSVLKENNICKDIGDAALETKASIEVARRVHNEELNGRFKGKVEEFQEDMATLHRQDMVSIEKNRDKVQNFVQDFQQKAQLQYEQLEVEFRERSDQVPKLLVEQQELTREVVKLTSESRSKIESLTESNANLARDWSIQTGKEEEEACAKMTSFGSNNLEVIAEAQLAERNYFSKQMKKGHLNSTSEEPKKLEPRA